MLPVLSVYREAITGLIKKAMDVTNVQAEDDVIGLVDEESAFDDEMNGTGEMRCYYDNPKHRNTETK